MAEEADWSYLNGDMLEKIGKKIDVYSDYVRFSAVCVGWRSSLANNPPKHLEQQFPCLLSTPIPSTIPIPPTPTTPTPCLLNPLVPEVVQVQLPPIDTLCISSFSKGWLIAVEKNGTSVYLINPFTAATNQIQIQQLPPIHTFPSVMEYNPDRIEEEITVGTPDNNRIWSLEEISQYFLWKIVLSSSRLNAKEFVAMAIYGEFGQLAYCKYEDKQWTPVNEVFINDVIFHKGKFYAVSSTGRVFVITDLESSSPKAVCIINPISIDNRIASRIYLVEWYGDLLMIYRNIQFRDSFKMVMAMINNMVVARNLQWRKDIDDYYQTVNFEIFKLNIDSTSLTKARLEKFSTLDNHTLFVGGSESITFPSSDFPKCIGNQIYFSDEVLLEDLEYSDHGVFDYNKKELHPLPGYRHHPQQFARIWLMRHKH